MNLSLLIKNFPSIWSYFVNSHAGGGSLWTPLAIKSISLEILTLNELYFPNYPEFEYYNFYWNQNFSKAIPLQKLCLKKNLFSKVDFKFWTHWELPKNLHFFLIEKWWKKSFWKKFGLFEKGPYWIAFIKLSIETNRQQ